MKNEWEILFTYLCYQYRRCCSGLSPSSGRGEGYFDHNSSTDIDAEVINCLNERSVNENITLFVCVKNQVYRNVIDAVVVVGRCPACGLL